MLVLTRMSVLLWFHCSSDHRLNLSSLLPILDNFFDLKSRTVIWLGATNKWPNLFLIMYVSRFWDQDRFTLVSYYFDEIKLFSATLISPVSLLEFCVILCDLVWGPVKGFSNKWTIMWLFLVFFVSTLVSRQAHRDYLSRFYSDLQVLHQNLDYQHSLIFHSLFHKKFLFLMFRSWTFGSSCNNAYYTDTFFIVIAHVTCAATIKFLTGEHLKAHHPMDQ